MKTTEDQTVAMNDLMSYLINLIESDDSRYSFEWSAGNIMEVYDKDNEIGYKISVEQIEYDENGDALNL